MSDLISRQDSDKCLEDAEKENSTMKLIYLDDAIEAIEEERFPIDSDYAEGFMAAIDKFEWILKEWLPSAEPEIVLCKDCVKRNRKFGSLDEHYNRYNKSQCCPMIEYRGIPQGHEFDYQYCSWAEKRTND